jgi:transketolase
MYSISQLQEISNQVRRDILRMVHAVNSGHPGGSMGCADFLTCLFFEIMKHDPQKFSMDGIGEDMFFLSNGHISPAFYSVLARNGYFDIKELATFRKLGTRLQGHPTPAEHIPGVRIASGSLGQGLSAGIGAALAKKYNKDNSLVYCLMGDGELEEGQVWEAAMFASHKKVDNLIAVIDYNGKQIDGPTDEVMSLGDLKAKWLSFGWNVFEMNGNDISDILNNINIVKSNTGKEKPLIILMHTEMGYGVDFMMGTHKWHGVAPNDEQLAKALAQLNETLGDY